MALSPEWVALKIGQSGSEVPEYSVRVSKVVLGKALLKVEHFYRFADKFIKIKV